MTHQMPLLHSGTQRNHKDFSSDVSSNAVLVWHQMQNFFGKLWLWLCLGRPWRSALNLNKLGKFCQIWPRAIYFRERPPGLLQHVLTVLVFWSWVLPLTRLPPSSRSLRLCLWASMLLYGPVDIAWICCPQLPHHPCKNGTHSTCFYSTGGHTPIILF